MPIELRASSVGCVFEFLDGLYVDSGFHGVHVVAAGAAGVSLHV